MRYLEAEKAGIKLRPEHVIIIATLFIGLVLLARLVL